MSDIEVEEDNILDPKTFISYAFGCIVFGCLIGAGLRITFAPYHLTIDKVIAAMMVLFIAGTIPAVFLHWWQNRNLVEPILSDYSDYDEGEEGE